MNNEEQIDTSLIFKSLLRRKKFIFFWVFISSLISSIYSLTVKPIWEGQFNILIKQNRSMEETQSNMSLLPEILSGGKNAVKETDRLILSSPLVLKPVYNFTKDYYRNKKVDVDSLTFKSWLKDLSVEFEYKSAVLAVKYQNSDKELILNNLNMIASEYKKYSKNQTEKVLKNTRIYLEDQKKIMEEKAMDSQRKFNKFSIENGLGNIDGFVGLGKPVGRGSKSIDFSNTGLEGLLNKEILKSKNILSGGKTDDNAGQRYQNQFSKLESYEAQYTDLSSKLKPNSQTLKTLKQKIENLKKSLKRPNEILVEYNLLSKKAARDEEILEDIIYRLEIIKLRQIEEPSEWEIISEPIIDKKRKFPDRKKIVGLSILFTLIISSIYLLIEEKISRRIFYKKDIIRLLDCKYIYTFDKKENNLITKFIKNLTREFTNKKVGLVDFTEKVNNISKIIEGDISYLNLINLEVEKEINEVNKIIIFIEGGNIKIEDITLINKYISIYGEKFLGWILIT